MGNKAFSSWSLRGWLTMKRTGADFDEVLGDRLRPPLTVFRPTDYFNLIDAQQFGRGLAFADLFQDILFLA